MMEGEGRGVAMIRRAEIDTRAPFSSVKEAVALFGEKVLVGELYANRLKEMHGEAIGDGSSRLGTLTAELEETKHDLEKAREESMAMLNCLSYLKEELERTKRELQKMKERETEKLVEFEIEDVKVVPDLTKFEVRKTQTSNEQGTEFQKKRYVTFANPPSLAQVMAPHGVEKLERHPSLRKKKKKPLIPLIGGIFSTKPRNGIAKKPLNYSIVSTKSTFSSNIEFFFVHL